MNLIEQCPKNRNRQKDQRNAPKNRPVDAPRLDVHAPGGGLGRVVVPSKPEDDGGQGHEDAGHRESPAVTRTITSPRDQEKPKKSADIDGPIEQSVNFPEF